MGLRINSDSYCGFGLFNTSQRNVKVWRTLVPNWLLARYTIDQQISADPISVMSRGNDNDLFALICSIRYVNDSCYAKTQYYRKLPYEGSPCVRLKVIDEIITDEEITVSYRSDFFDADNVYCLCPNHTSIKSKQAPSRHCRLELPALPEKGFHSRFSFFCSHTVEKAVTARCKIKRMFAAFRARVRQMLASIL